MIYVGGLALGTLERHIESAQKRSLKRKRKGGSRLKKKGELVFV